MTSEVTGFRLFLQQLRAILWKAWLVRKRHWLSSLIEVLLPLAYTLMIAFFMSKMEIGSSKKGQQPAKIYDYPFFELSKLTSLSSSSYLLYAPNSMANKRIIDKMFAILNETSDKRNRLKSEGFPNEAALMKWHQEKMENNTYLQDISAIVFYDVPEMFNATSNEIKYQIRSQENFLRTTSETWRFNFDGSPSYSSTEYSRDFLQLQYLVNEAYLDLKAHDLGVKHERLSQLNMTFLPYPSYQDSGSALITGSIVPGLLISCFIVSIPMIVKRLTDEKVNGSREMFRMVGLSDWIYWIGNFIHHFGFLYTISIIILAILHFGGLFHHTNFMLLMILMFVYITQSVLLSFLISILFNRPVVGIVVAVIIWNFSQAPGVVLSPMIAGSNDFGRLWSCLLSNSGITFAMQVIFILENQEDGASFSNLYKPTLALGDLSLGIIMAMMLISCFLTGFLIWYLDNVWPWQPGVPKPIWFFFTREYWFGSRANKSSDEEVTYDSRYFESRDSSTPTAIAVKNVTKVYGQLSKKVAVDNVSLNIYRDEITCLLGHNGAGKTTTMSMMTGMFPPTSGKIFVNGIDLLKDTKHARRSMSLCPQHNPLYTELTVKEHLSLYAAIKGYPSRLLDTEVNKVVAEITLQEHASKQAGYLSGGMKRKLCLGVALVGETKVVVLDEPTSGLDTEVRRSIWDVLRNVRSSGRTILLSTHDMEEADALGDRIVIMSEGQVTCAGTSMFLKSVFGAGYTLKIAKLQGFNVDTVSKEVRKHFPRSQVKSNVGSEITFSLESEENQTDSTMLPNFFKQLEEKKDDLAIESFGLSVTTMEDVFLKVGEMSAMLLGLQNAKNKKSSSSLSGTSSSSSDTSSLLTPDTVIPLSTDDDNGERLTGYPLEWQRIIGLFIKRFDYGKRYWPMLLFQILVPAFILFLSFQVTNSVFKLTKGEKALDLDLMSIYGKHHQVIYQNNMENDSFGEYWKNGVLADGLKIREITKNANVSKELLENDAKGVSVKNFVKKFVIGVTVKEGSKYNLWVNNEAYHSPPLAMSQFYRSMEGMLFNDKAAKNHIHVSSLPLPSRYSSQPAGVFLIYSLRIIWSFLLPISMPFLAASYVLFPSHERLSKAKLIQVMTGLHPLLLHAVNFLYDMIQHILAICVILIVISIFDVNKIFFHSSASTASVFLVMLLLGVSVLPIAYLFSFLTKKTSTAYSVLVMIFIISGFIFSIIGTVLLAMTRGSWMKKSTMNGINWILSVSPVYTLSSAMAKIYEHGTHKYVCRQIPQDKLLKTCKGAFSDFYLQGCCPETCKDTIFGDYCLVDNPVFAGERGIGQELLMMLVVAIIGAALLAISETTLLRGLVSMFRHPFRPEVTIQEEDVLREKQRINDIVVHGDYSADALVVDDLVKQFKNFHAVKGVSFGVHHQECFGLLGVNGAGKTTTFGMITGDIEPTFGNAYQGGTDVVTSISEYQKQIGYCPQFDPLLDKMTGREMLNLFARLRGVHTRNVNVIVNNLIEMTDLAKHADKTTESYSGGNKRKLSLALALIANPKIILLDEPTAGVDAAARRKIWSLLSFIRRAYSCSIVLTSHSMQECETLCSRLAIMVSGSLRCLASTQQLRAKYGRGYTLVIKLARDNLYSQEYISSLWSHIQLVIPGVALTDQHETLWTLRVPDKSVKWSSLFESMEEMKENFHLEDYTISDTTLEQIFISFARANDNNGLH